MSEQSLDRQTSEVLDIPERRVVVKDASELPTSYCQTPGGTIFSTTPGGTRIIYDRKFLLDMRNSPYTKTPPSRLAIIPDILKEEPALPAPPKVRNPDLTSQVNNSKEFHASDAEVFSMED